MDVRLTNRQDAEWPRKSPSINVCLRILAQAAAQLWGCWHGDMLAKWGIGTMGKLFGHMFGNIKLTFAIAAMTVGSIAVAILAVSLGVFLTLSASARDDANAAVAAATRITAAILQVNLPSLDVV